MHDAQSRLAVYDEMIDLCQRYLLEMKDGTEWRDAAFQLFEKNWDELKRRLPSEETGALSREEREQEVARCHTLRVLYQSIIDRMERQFSQLTSQVQGVRQSKTIMNAYQGMGRTDQVAYYFDEKK
ncbi:MEKHLA domain-containing protein [Paenibacillus profundus]|uniref:MEKHLA domain-containing protein n=1 Tax=Paenibacillus profundus TaxID=1173085 RepID=A0ABS8YEG3_9BACL|nr:MEKHLA domain-containing protein [Paenibacillus profundus]MCE5169309.1 MEKHLA domain-containing protein [Paenibacillus profundus]